MPTILAITFSIAFAVFMTMAIAGRAKQADAATHCGVTQPRISDLCAGVCRGSPWDALVNIATALGHRVHVELEPA